MKICYDGGVMPSQLSDGSGIGDGDSDDDGDGDNSDDSDDEIPERFRSMLKPETILQLNKARAERKEAARKAREAELAAVFIECEKRLAALITVIGDEARAYKRRKCSLKYFQSTIAGLERTLHEVKGLNNVGAGRKCQ